MAQYLAVLELSSLDGANGFKMNGVAAGDNSGHSVASGDINGDGFADLIVGAFLAGSASGASYVVFGKASGFGATLELSSLDGDNGYRFVGEAANYASGYSVASAGDVNDDGFDDLIVGAWEAAPNGASSGESYVVFGGTGELGNLAELDVFDGTADGTIDLGNVDGNSGFKINGEAGGDLSGWSVASAGDVNGDGFADLIVGAYGASPNGGSSGASYVVFGKASGFSAELDLSSLNGTTGFKMNGEAAYDHAGMSVASAGDIDGDGFADLIVGAFGADPNGSSSGASYVVFGKASGFGATLDLSSLDGNNGFKINGEVATDKSGFSVASAGDVNADGFADLIVGAPSSAGDNPGMSYVVFGKNTGFGAELDLSSLDGVNGFQINGEVDTDRSGFSVASAGDFNGDGFDDLIVSARNADPNGTNSGASYVVFGKETDWDATLELSDLNGNNGFQINGEVAGDYSGVSVASAGDVNGDGFADLIVGAYFADPHGDQSGASYVIFGSAPGEAVTRIGTSIANTIHGSAFNDTLKGMGSTDTLYGGDGKDNLTGGTDADTMYGGSGKDTFLFGNAGQSSSTSYDRIEDFNPSKDKFDTPVSVSGIDATIASGQLRLGHFDSDLGTAVSGPLGASHAVLFTPTTGNLAGTTFLVVDLNNTGSYEANSDLVIELANNPSSLSVDNFI